MKKFLKVATVLTLCVSASFVHAQKSKKVTHHFLKSGWASGGPAIYNREFKETWSTSDNSETTDAWHLPDGGIVYSFCTRGRDCKSGVVRLDKNKKEMWRYNCPDGNTNHSCQPLPTKGFLLGESNNNGMWLVEIDKKGKERVRIKVADSCKDKFHGFRQVRKTRKGTYLGTKMYEATGYEWDKKGKLLRTFPHALFVAIRLPNGNTLVSAAHPAPGHGIVIEYDKKGKVVWEVTEEDLNKLGVKTIMACGVQRLPNGNTVITSVKHGKQIGQGDPVKAYEITRDKKLVWSIPSSTHNKNMGNIQILDVKGDVYKLQVLK